MDLHRRQGSSPSFRTVRLPELASNASSAENAPERPFAMNERASNVRRQLLKRESDNLPEFERPSSLRRQVLVKRESDNWSDNNERPSSLRRQLVKRESDHVAESNNERSGSLRRQILKRDSDNLSDYDQRPRSARSSGGLYNGGSPSPVGRRIGNDEPRLSGGFPPRLALFTQVSGDFEADSPRSSMDRERPFFATGPDRGSQRFAQSPRPSPRIGARNLLDSPRGESVRVVSQRAMNSQVAKAYLQTIEQQKVLRDKAQKAKEASELLENKRKAARRMLGSFSMYQIDPLVMPEIISSRPPPIVPRVSNLGRKPSAEAYASPDVLEEEYENVISTLLERRILSKFLLMWRTVVAYRKYLRSQQNFLFDKETPMVPLPRKKNGRMLPPRPSNNNRNNPVVPRPARISVVRRPSIMAPISDEDIAAHQDAFIELVSKTEHRHQLNLGRRNTRSRLSVVGTDGVPKPRKSIGVFKTPASVPENRALTTEEAEEIAPLPPASPLLEKSLPVSTSTGANLELPRPANSRKLAPPSASGPPPPLAISVVKDTKGMQRRRSWSKMGFDALKSMFTTPGTKLLSRIPSKERLMVRIPSKERLAQPASKPKA